MSEITSMMVVAALAVTAVVVFLAVFYHRQQKKEEIILKADIKDKPLGISGYSGGFQFREKIRSWTQTATGVWTVEFENGMQIHGVTENDFTIVGKVSAALGKIIVAFFKEPYTHARRTPLPEHALDSLLDVSEKQRKFIANEVRQEILEEKEMKELIKGEPTYITTNTP